MSHLLSQIQGILISDLDGTLSFKGAPIDREIIQYLHKLEQNGWIIVFASGRTFQWAKKHLEDCTFPYYIAPYNGAALWHSSTQKKEECLYSHTISAQEVESIWPLIQRYGALLYSAKPSDMIFTTPSAFSSNIWEHVEMRRKRQKEEWNVIHNLLQFPQDSIQKVFSIRIFFEEKMLDDVKKNIMGLISSTGLYGSFMKDSFSSNMRILQVTASNATKKTPITWLKKKFGHVPVIGIGDDINDLPMLEASDIAIAIQNAEPEVLSIAEYVTPGTSAKEITETISQAVAKCILN